MCCSRGGSNLAGSIDVAFNPAVLAVALAGADEEASSDSGKPRVKRAVGKDGDIDPDLAKFVRIRLVELALKNAEVLPPGSRSDLPTL